MTVVDVSTHQNEIDSVGDFVFVPRKDILSCYFGSMEQAPVHCQRIEAKLLEL